MPHGYRHERDIALLELVQIRFGHKLEHAPILPVFGASQNAGSDQVVGHLFFDG